MNKRPISIALVSWLFIAAGVIGLAYHATEIKTKPPFDYAIVWVCMVRLLAIIAGVFMLCGRNWARCLSMLWMAYHLVPSALHSLSELVMHGLLFAVITYILLRPRASEYFRSMRNRGTP